MQKSYESMAVTISMSYSASDLRIFLFKRNIFIVMGKLVPLLWELKELLFKLLIMSYCTSRNQVVKI